MRVWGNLTLTGVAKHLCVTLGIKEKTWLGPGESASCAVYGMHGLWPSATKKKLGTMGSQYSALWLAEPIRAGSPHLHLTPNKLPVNQNKISTLHHHYRSGSKCYE